MSKSNAVVLCAALISGALGGCSGNSDPGGATSPDPAEPAGDDGEVSRPDASQRDGSVRPKPRDAGVTAQDAALRADAGDSEVSDAGPVGNADPAGPLNMAPVSFGKNVKVNDATSRGQQVEVMMAVHPSGLVLAGWADSSTRSCAFSVSDDGGETWSKNTFAATQAMSGSAFAGDPAVAIDERGNLFAGCQDYASGGLGTNYVLLAHSKDRGATWSPFKRVNQSLDKPWLGATGDGTVLLTWLGNPGGVKRSTDFGETWSQPISLGYINHGTTMSISSTGLAHMAYNTNENTVTYRRSTDRGVNFEAAKNLSPQGTPCRSPCSPRSHPIVGAGADPSGQVVAITWASTQQHADSEGDDDVWVIVSYDAGKSFSAPIRVNDNMNKSRQFQPWAAVDSYGAVHVVWTDLRNSGQNDTYYARMVDMELGFEANVKVNDGTGKPASFLGDYKGVEVLGRDVVVIWTDSRSNDGGDIYFARARDAAAAGGPLMR
jgi:BNR/Asp-box repeat